MKTTQVRTCTPLGRLVYPKLNKAVQFKTKAGNFEGKFYYETCLDLTGEDAAGFEKWLTEYAKDYAKRIGKRSVSIDHVLAPAVEKTKDGERIELEDTLRFRFKVNNFERNGEIVDRKPAFFLPNGLPYEQEPQVAGGTLAQIGFSVYEWEAGPNKSFTLQPEMIVIHELVERRAAGPGGFADYGFGGPQRPATNTVQRQAAQPSGADF